jgi:hypothetical protein
MHISPLQFSAWFACRGTFKDTSVCYEDKLRTLDSISRTPSGEISMTITTAHIPAIVALIAGVLILIMPRLLNLVVAIYLICVGLIGLGVLKWLHM